MAWWHLRIMMYSEKNYYVYINDFQKNTICFYFLSQLLLISFHFSAKIVSLSSKISTQRLTFSQSQLWVKKKIPCVSTSGLKLSHEGSIGMLRQPRPTHSPIKLNLWERLKVWCCYYLSCSSRKSFNTKMGCIYWPLNFKEPFKTGKKWQKTKLY